MRHADHSTVSKVIAEQYQVGHNEVDPYFPVQVSCIQAEVTVLHTDHSPVSEVLNELCQTGHGETDPYSPIQVGYVQAETAESHTYQE